MARIDRPALVTSAALALLAATAPSSEAGAYGDTFDLGIVQAPLVAPSAAYFVPPSVLRDSFAVSPDTVIAAARPMRADELARLLDEDDEDNVASDHLLFVVPNQGANMARWSGSADCAQQSIILRVWNGETWLPFVSPENPTVHSAAFVGLPDEPSSFVLVQQHNGTREHNRLRTRSMQFARFPGTHALIDAGLAQADIAVYVAPPSRASNARSPLDDCVVDCVKGWIEPAALRTALGDRRFDRSGAELIFLASNGDAPHVLATIGVDRGCVRGPHGELTDPDAHPTSEATRSLRLALARRATPATTDREATLAVTREETPCVVELAIGRAAPCLLFAPSITRSGRDGGEPLFQFEVRRAGASVVLQPKGRFGADSLGRTEFENCPELGFDYAFLVCGPGVVKLVIRPRATPFDAEIRAVVTPLTNPFERSQAGVEQETTPYVSLHVE